MLPQADMSNIGNTQVISSNVAVFRNCTEMFDLQMTFGW